MRYKSQSVAYWYFAVAMVLFGLQLVFGLLSAAKYLGPDPLLYILPFDVTKVIHTNLLIVWVLTGFMGATYWMVPDESRTELHSVKLAYVQLVLWALMGVTAVIGYLFRYGTGNKLLEQPLPHKIVIVVVHADVPLQHRHDDQEVAAASPPPKACWCWASACAAVLYLPALLQYENYTVSIFYRWWTIHLWVEGVWEMIQGGFLAYLLIRLSGADREVMEKWLYVIVGLVFIAGILGTAHHYYWVGVPTLLAADRRHLQRARAAGAGRHGDLRLLGDAPLRPGAPEHAGAALDGRQRRLHAVRRRPAGAGAHLAGRQQVDARHADHRHARPRRVLRCLRDDRAGDDHLRPAGDDAGRPEQGSSHRLLVVLAAAGRHVRHDAVVRDRRHRRRSIWSASSGWAISTRS